MTIQQTIDVPANRKVHFDIILPEGVPCGQTEVILDFKPAAVQMESAFKDRVLLQLKKNDRKKAEAARQRLRGMFKTDGHDVDRFLEWKQSERNIEYAVEQREDGERNNRLS
jgi:hypothetical protein